MMPSPFQFNDLKEQLPPSKTLEYKKFGCVNPWFYIYLRPDGSYRPCCYLPFEGNIIKTTFKGYEQSDTVKERKNNLIHHVESSCMANVCKGQIMGRVDDDSNLLMDYKRIFLNGKKDSKAS